MYEAQLRAADGKPCSELARRALQAAKSADTVGDWQAAIRHFTVAIKNGSNDPQVYFRLGVLLRKTHGDLRLSLAHLRKASLLQPDQVVYRRELAELYDVLGFPINARSQRERIQEIQGVVPTKRTWWFW